MSGNYYPHRNRCDQCRHFYRDLLDYFGADKLARMGVGLCTRNSPKPVPDSEAFEIFFPPMVSERSVCGDFEARCPQN